MCIRDSLVVVNDQHAARPSVRRSTVARVLIVDDDEDFTVAAAEMLRLADHEVAV